MLVVVASRGSGRIHTIYNSHHSSPLTDSLVEIKTNQTPSRPQTSRNLDHNPIVLTFTWHFLAMDSMGPTQNPKTVSLFITPSASTYLGKVCLLNGGNGKFCRDNLMRYLTNFIQLISRYLTTLVSF